MTITLSHKMLITSALALAFIAPAFVQADEHTGSTTATTTPKEVKGNHGKKATSTVDRTCMAGAVTTREAALKTAWTTFTGSITSALDKRAAALVAAWNASKEGSKDGIKKAWSDWKKDRTAAHSKLRTDRKAAWDAFKKTAKDSCKVKTPKEEGLEKSGSDTVNL